MSVEKLDVESVKAAAAAGPQAQADALSLLLQLMLEKERESLTAVRRDSAKVAAKDRADKLENAAYIQKKVAEQVRCNHLKGGRHRDSSAKEDFHVSQHVFIDGSTVVRCLLCGLRVMPGDTSEFFHRDGLPVKNWSGVGWKDAKEGKHSILHMLSHTTNKITRSEMPQAGQTNTGEDKPLTIENIDKISF